MKIQHFALMYPHNCIQGYAFVAGFIGVYKVMQLCNCLAYVWQITVIIVNAVVSSVVYIYVKNNLRHDSYPFKVTKFNILYGLCVL